MKNPVYFYVTIRVNGHDVLVTTEEAATPEVICGIISHVQKLEGEIE